MSTMVRGTEKAVGPVRPAAKDGLSAMFYHALHIRYAVISQFEKLPMDLTDRLAVLTDQLETLAHVWNLTLIKDATYRAELSTGNPIILQVYQKGKGLFPENFESRILAGAYLHEEIVKVPSVIDYPYIRLYWRLYYEGFLGEDISDRRMLMDFVRNHIGDPIHTRYKHLPYYPHPRVPQLPTAEADEAFVETQ